MRLPIRETPSVPSDKITVIPNWSLPETETVAPADAVKALRAEWKLDGKLVVGYSGNFGRVHDFTTVLAAAEALRDDLRIHFLFVGDGAQRAWLEERVAALGLANVTLRPYQPLERLAVSLAVPDLHLVSQKPEVTGLVVPSKLYAVLAAGRPALFIGDTGGEIARQIVDAGCGRAFPVGAHGELASALRDFVRAPALVAEMGQRAWALWEARYQRRKVLAAWQALLANVAPTSRLAPRSGRAVSPASDGVHPWALRKIKRLWGARTEAKRHPIDPPTSSFGSAKRPWGERMRFQVGRGARLVEVPSVLPVGSSGTLRHEAFCRRQPVYRRRRPT